MNQKLHAIILAGGKGTRMHSDMPKCAYPFCGKPMISYIISSCKEAHIDDIIVVVGYKHEELIKCLPNDVRYVLQEEQLGTGHATKCAKKYLENEDGLTLIFPGDMPTIDCETITNLINTHIKDKNVLTDITTIFEDPKQYGRIERENGQIRRIVEFKDCNEEQKKIKEINVALYCIDNKVLFNTLDLIKNDNNAKEYYLTDIVEILGKDNRVDAYIAPNDYRLVGINDLETLKVVEEEYKKHHNK
ncbi:MAG: NTP transferase domain-containing protein [Bacilli bacterium]|nr:NTP transferase domain-containing protein [Bacilli bacterium]